MGAHDLSFLFAISDLHEPLEKGLAAFAVAKPVTLPVWAVDNFYLSAESSYVEQRWRPWWFQPPVLACMGDDDIEEVDVKKSARVGYTKMVMAHLGYKLQHKRRNVAVWQPTDDDRDQFVKTELEPMFRDVTCMREIFPEFLSAKNKSNTVKQKMLLGCTIHMLGGKAAKNYRRISVDDVVLDEISGFDLNIENEGDPYGLAAKRVEGASFPKKITGSTPKQKGLCQITSRILRALYVFKPHIPCPHCDVMHVLTFGDKKSQHGMRWEKCETDDETAETVRQLCPSCGALYSQAEYRAVEDRGEYRTESGVRLTITPDGVPVFFDANGNPMPKPRQVAFDGIWSAYSPNVSWPSIVREYLAAIKKKRAGDSATLQTFTNTTLGETWHEEGEKTDAGALAKRAEDFRLRTVPMGGLVLVAGVDVQDDRWEVEVLAVGRGIETWTVDYVVLYGNPGVAADWDKVDTYLQSKFRHRSGVELGISATGIDTGGHFTHEVYNFCRARESRRVFALKGNSQPGTPIKGKASMQDVNWRGRVLKHGVKLWLVGTDTAKDLLHSRLKIERPGSGYMHTSKHLPDAWFAGITIEQRVLQKTSTGAVYRWINPNHGRNEPLDTTVYCYFCIEALDLGRNTDKMWSKLEEKIQPKTGDLFEAVDVAQDEPTEVKTSTQVETKERDEIGPQPQNTQEEEPFIPADLRRKSTKQPRRARRSSPPTLEGW